MKQRKTIAHEFVKAIPDKLEEGTLYISLDHATVAHNCCCGCGHEVVTPLSPTDWKLTYDGVSVSLFPSIGNWGFACQSHYWIENSTVRWAEQWSKVQIDIGRARDRQLKQTYYATDAQASGAKQPAGATQQIAQRPREGIWSRLWRWRAG